MPRKNGNNNGRKLTTPQSVNAAIKVICDIMRRSNCAGALQYVPELTWILFLHILDEREIREAEEAEAVGAEFTPSLVAPYRWQDWAAPDGTRRLELQMGILGGFFDSMVGPDRMAAATACYRISKPSKSSPTPPHGKRSSVRSCPGWSVCASTPNGTC